MRLAPDEQAAQQADLARDELGRPQARRVEAEDGRPARRASRGRRSRSRRSPPTARLDGAAADVGRDERGEPGRRVEVDRRRACAPTDRPADAARRSSTTGSPAPPAGGVVGEPARTARRRRRRGSAGRRPARRGPARAPRSRPRGCPAGATSTARGSTVGSVSSGRLERRRSRARTGSRRVTPRAAASTVGRSVNVGAVDAASVRVVEGRRRADAVDRRRRRASIARAAPARTGDRPGRGAAGRTAARRRRRSGGRLRRGGRTRPAHRGRSPGVRRVAGARGVALEGQLDDPLADRRRSVAALGRQRREEADRREARDGVDLGQVDPRRRPAGSRSGRSPRRRWPGRRRARACASPRASRSVDLGAGRGLGQAGRVLGGVVVELVAGHDLAGAVQLESRRVVADDRDLEVARAGEVGLDEREVS